MKKLTFILWLPNRIAILYFLLMPGLCMSQLGIILNEVDPGYSANQLEEDFEGNVIVAGNNFVSKYNPTQSAYMWSTTILPAEGSSGYVSIQDMTIDGSGNSYLTGWYTGSVAFGSTVLTSLTNTNHIYQKSDLFVTKLNPNGNFLWAKSLGTNAGTDRGNAITVDAPGNVYVTGYFCNKICSGPPQGSPPEIEDIYVAKLNNSGSLLWQKRFAPSKVICENGGGGYDITVDASGNIYATGWFQGTFKFGSTAALTLTSLGWGDVFTLKLNSTGSALWAKAGRGAGSDRGLSLYLDAVGNINVGGYYGNNAAGNITFAPFILADVDGNAGAPGPSVSNAFLVQYTSAGNINWAINPAPVSGIHNEVNNIIADAGSPLRISMPELGMKTYSSAGIETSAMLMEDNFTMLDGYPYDKTNIRDLTASASGYMLSMSTYCGTVPLANLALTNINCQNCADWYTCSASSHSDLYIIKSTIPPPVNSPIVSRSTPEIEGHTYLGTFNGHSYYLSECETNWFQANDVAVEMGGYLATITSEDEDCFLAPFAPFIDEYDPAHATGGAWIGLLMTYDYEQNDSCNIWQWWNGESVVYENFKGEGAPNHGYCGIAVAIGYVGSSLIGCNQYEYSWVGRYLENSPGNFVLSKYIVEFDEDPGCSNPDKTYVCHNGNTICINQNSLQGHLNHGDFAGPCSPCNSNLAEYTDGNFPIETSHHEAEKVTDYNQDRYGLDEDILVSPNPSRDEINIGLPTSFTNGVLRMFSLRGEEIMIYNVTTDGVSHLDISFLPAGMYVIDLISPAGHWQKKFVRAE